jgi:hypothetical protein
MTDLRDPAVLLAAVRASGARPVDDLTLAQLDSMRVRAKNAGREMVRCTPPPGSSGKGRSRVTTLGWSPHATPSPEDSNAYPVRRLTATAQLCACRKPHPCRLSSMAVLVDDSAEAVLSIYGEAFDLGGLKRLGPSSQGFCGRE